MTKLDINTNGAWRQVMTVTPGVEATVKQACVDITAAAAQAGGPRAGPTWRLRGAQGHIYLRCECHAASGVTAWTAPIRQASAAQGEST